MWDGAVRKVAVTQLGGKLHSTNPQTPDRHTPERPVAWAWLDGCSDERSTSPGGVPGDYDVDTVSGDVPQET